jgi:DNA helicase II / ATP-dependent DNA helicase PcrA
MTITDQDIQYAESIIFGRTGEFDEERVNFIKNLNIVDLQAVPGSGKTTALLAKLIILERLMPLPQNKGVLVISHTNTAVNEIKEKIGESCPKLFSYPNYIGTIQSFVDQFLAAPYYTMSAKKKLYRIDNEAYYEALEKRLRIPLPGADRNVISKIGHIKNANPDLLVSCRLKHQSNGNIILAASTNGGQLEIKKPRGNTRNYTDYTPQEKQAVYNYILKLKQKIISDGILCYDEAYYLANRYLFKYPVVQRLLQNRFRFVFVDEMQDMDVHQIEILDKIFNEPLEGTLTYQRIGDKNQSIYNGGDIPDSDVWNSNGRQLMTITGSKRFHARIADVVKTFGIDYIDIVGNDNLTPCEPILLLYDNHSIENVIPYFPQLIRAEAEAHGIELNPNHKIKAIAWVKNHAENTCLKSYFNRLDPLAKTEKHDFKNLLSYLSQNFPADKGLAEIRKSILNAILKLCRIENLKISGRSYFTKATFIEFYKTKPTYSDFTQNLLMWCEGVYKHQAGRVHASMQAEIPLLLAVVFGHTQISENGISFINSTEIEFPPADEGEEKICTEFVCPVTGLKVEVATVHSVKGETHFATLYLESQYYSQSESQRAMEQLLGSNFNDRGKRNRQTARMMYVGMSRPQQFLVLACHVDNIKDNLEELGKRWKIDSSLLTPINTAQQG